MLNNHKPFFTVEDARSMALELYGLRVEARALPGERDCNFYLKTETGQEYVLKIAPAVEQLGTIDLQNKALEGWPQTILYDHYRMYVLRQKQNYRNTYKRRWQEAFREDAYIHSWYSIGGNKASYIRIVV